MKFQPNPIIDSIYAIILSSPAGISEYDLLGRLQEDESITVFSDDFFSPADDSVALFRKHFLIMNALYQLQAKLISEGQYLLVSPLNIKLGPINDADETNMSTENASQKLREYYLDLSHFDQTDKAEVDGMLEGFWQRYIANDKRYDALQILGLTSEADLDEVKQTYRRLVSEHHPDKGGDSTQFTVIRQAYETLLQSGIK